MLITIIILVNFSNSAKFKRMIMIIVDPLTSFSLHNLENDSCKNFELPSFYFENVVDRNILLYLASVAWIQQQSLKLGIHGKSIKFSTRWRYCQATQENNHNSLTANIELLNNNSHGSSPPGGLVSPSGGFVSLLCDQGLNFASILLCQASCSD